MGDLNLGKLFAVRVLVHLLIAVSYLAIVIALLLAAPRREFRRYSPILILVALFVAVAGGGHLLGTLQLWTEMPDLETWWNISACIIAATAAAVIVPRLREYLLMPRVTAELRGQAGFLEEQQTLLQAIQDSVSDGILLLDADGRIKAFNAAALRILWGGDGQSRTAPVSKEEAVRTLVQAEPEQGVIRFEGLLLERFSTNVPGFGQLYILRDVTARRRLEEEREQLQAKLTEAQRLESLRRLAEGVAHEINNQLTGIMGNAGLALDLLPASDPLRTMLEDILRGSERTADISWELLAFSGKTGRFVVEFVNLSSMVDDLAGLARASIAKRVQLRVETRPELPMVEADPTQLRQVVLNLIANGAEAVGEDQGWVRVSTGVYDLTSAEVPNLAGMRDLSPGRYVSIEVQDSGCGMDEEMRSRIFDPFFTTKAPGRGLGLASLLGIVRSHGGAVQVDSTPGKGSTFRVLLPSSQAPVETPKPVRPVEPARDQATILVVEDEAIVRRIAVAALMQYGFDVVVAENGQIAVELFEKMAARISLVLLDVAMPVMAGDQAIRHIKRIRPDVPVVLCSGHQEAEAVELFHPADVAGFVQKPYTPRQLVEKLRAVLERAAIV